MKTIQHLALEVIASGPEQSMMFAFCEAYGIYFAPQEPPYLTMARIARWALLMRNDVTKIPADIPHVVSGWESGKDQPMSEGGQV
jgi:hypothetical protein